MRRHFPTKSGFSLVEVLIASALLALVLGGVMGIGRILGKQGLQSNSTFQVGQISRIFANDIQNAGAWTRTVADAANATTFNCITHPGTTCVGQGGSFRLNDASGAPINGFLPALAGGKAYYQFNSSGQPCGQFNPPPGNGNDSCPYGLALTWTAICPPGACTSANVQIMANGSWTYNPAPASTPGAVNPRMIAFNAANYNFQVSPGAGATGTCQPGTIAVGFNPNTGAPICKVLYSKQTVCSTTYQGTFQNWGCTALCPTGTIATGGGIQAGCVFMNTAGGFYYSLDTPKNGFFCDVNIGTCSCGSPAPAGGDGCGSTCYAICTGWKDPP